MDEQKILSEDQIRHLISDAQVGGQIRGFCQHPGFKIFEKALELELLDKKNTWLKGSDEDARLERIRAQGLQRALTILKQFMITGDNAARILKDNETPAE